MAVKSKSMIDGAAVKRLRMARGMSLADLASAAGVSRGFIYLLERNQTGVSFDNAQKIAKTLEIDISSISRNDQSEVGNGIPVWLNYLIAKYNLSKYDQDLLKKFVVDSGLSEEVTDETKDEFEKRWDAFYKTVQSFLPNSVDRFFSDSEVSSLLDGMRIGGTKDWRIVYERFTKLITDRCGDGAGVQNGAEWKSHVANVLKIDEVEIDDHMELSTFFNVHPELACPSIMGGVALVASNQRMYAAVYEKKNGGYVFIHDVRGDKAECRDFPFWHEAARLLVDPLLKSGRGVAAIPDGLERTPLERLLCRFAVWLAFGFGAARTRCGNCADLTMDKICAMRTELYPQATLRMVAAAALDLQSIPIVYIDASLRLKHPERVAKGIRIEEVEKMRDDPDAKLRIGYVYANIAAEETGFELRTGMRIARESPIFKAFANKTAIRASEDLAAWDYGLTGEVFVDAAYSDDHVRAIMTRRDKTGKGYGGKQL